MIYIGFDTGIMGGIGVLEEWPGGIAPSVYTMPIMKRYMSGNKVRNEVDPSSLWDWIQEHNFNNAVCAVEQVTFIPGRSSTARALQQGKNFGYVIMAITAAKLPYFIYRSQDWKKPYDLIKRDKRASIQVARRLYPKIEISTDGQADAILIARYLQQEQGNKRRTAGNES